MDPIVSGERFLIWLATHFLCAIFGGLIGRRQGREFEGIVWGAVLGILGLFAIFLRGPTAELKLRREEARLARDGGAQSPSVVVDPAVVGSLADQQARQKRFLGTFFFVVILVILALSVS